MIRKIPTVLILIIFICALVFYPDTNATQIISLVSITGEEIEIVYEGEGKLEASCSGFIAGPIYGEFIEADTVSFAIEEYDGEVIRKSKDYIYYKNNDTVCYAKIISDKTGVSLTSKESLINVQNIIFLVKGG